MKNKISQLLWILLGVGYGLAMRLLFANHILRTNMEVVSFAFMLGTPFVVGAIVVYGQRNSKPSIWKMIYAPWLAILLAMLGSAIALLEGAICIVLALPLFLLLSSIGGLMMGLILRYTDKGPTALNSFLLLPFMLVAFQPVMPERPKLLEERVAIEVAAPPQRIWAEILNARNIQRYELPPNFTHLIGVPRPVEGINISTPKGEIRYSKWDRGVHFSALVTQSVKNRSITWNYHFTSDSFPDGSMDEHVRIGGKYFDLYDTTFNLTPLSSGLTKLEIVSHYRVNTDINFYAVPVAKFIAHDFMSTILQFYKLRSERSNT